MIFSAIDVARWLEIAFLFFLYISGRIAQKIATESSHVDSCQILDDI